MENLWCKIECLRQKMHRLALKKGIAHPEVLLVSERLDDTINDLYKLELVNSVD